MTSREQIKERIKAGNQGGKPGQWSAIKSLMLAKECKTKGCSLSKKSGKAKSMKKWLKEDWQTSDGKPAIRKNKKGDTITTRFRPKKIWDSLSDKEKASLNRSKVLASKSGKQVSSIPEKVRDKANDFSRYPGVKRLSGGRISYRGEVFSGFNKPKSTPNHPTKSHVVLAKEGDTIRKLPFGQQGVKGSPKKKGESEAYRNRRKRFKARHAKNIAKGKLSRAYWANVTKW